MVAGGGRRWPGGMTLEETVPMQCTHLQTILNQTLGTGNDYFDFMTLDTEGAELSALQGLDFGVGYGVRPPTVLLSDR